MTFSQSQEDPRTQILRYRRAQKKRNAVVHQIYLLFTIYYSSPLLVVTWNWGGEFGLEFVLPHCCVLILPVRSLLLCHQLQKPAVCIIRVISISHMNYWNLYKAECAFMLTNVNIHHVINKSSFADHLKSVILCLLMQTNLL